MDGQINIENENFFCNLITFIKGSLVFVVSQAWNSAIQDLLAQTWIFSKYGKIIYAVVITFISVYVLKSLTGVNKIIQKCSSKNCFLFGGDQASKNNGRQASKN
jgi:hypothetical protein